MRHSKPEAKRVPKKLLQFTVVLFTFAFLIMLGWLSSPMSHDKAVTVTQETTFAEKKAEVKEEEPRRDVAGSPVYNATGPVEDFQNTMGNHSSILVMTVVGMVTFSVVMNFMRLR